MMDCSQVDALFASFDRKEIKRYKDYWDSVKPQTEREVFKRWLFAFMSVHTSWESNVRGYEAIKDFGQWANSGKKLEKLLVESRVGLYNNRRRFLMEFVYKFWQDPHRYMSPPVLLYQSGDWRKWRDTLVKDILGLGIAKVSFALEMIHPNEAKVTCMDTHLFQAYGLNQTKHAKYYKDIEDYWLAKCRKRRVPSYIARSILWDRKQEKTDSRYWSYVLEGE